MIHPKPSIHTFPIMKEAILWVFKLIKDLEKFHQNAVTILNCDGRGGQKCKDFCNNVFLEFQTLLSQEKDDSISK